PHRTVNMLTSVIPTAEPGRTENGSLSPRMCRGDTLVPTVVPANAGSHNHRPSLTKSVDLFGFSIDHAVSVPAFAGTTYLSIEHEQAACGLAGLHVGRTPVGVEKLRMGGG